MTAQEPHLRTADVIVVGAGLAGLAAAVTAAHRGRRVTVLDARSTPGGRARTHESNGYLHNEGPHALYRAGEVKAFLDRHGIDLPGGVPSTARAAGITATGDLVPMPWARSGDPRSVRLGARDLAHLSRFTAAVQTVGLDGLADVPMARWLADRVPEGLGRDAAHALARVATYTDDLDRLSADAGVLQVRRAARRNVAYLDGGFASIVSALRTRAEQAGAEVLTGVAVKQVRRAGRGWEVVTGEGSLHSDAVVLAAGGPATAAKVVGADAPELDRWVGAAIPVTASHLDVGMPGPWPAPPVVLGMGTPLYCNVHAPVARLAPDGHTAVVAMRYHHAGEHPDPSADRAALEALVTRLEPRWRERADDVRFGARLVVVHDQPHPDRGGLAGRPGPAVPGAPGLFVAGDWVGRHGLLSDAAVASGEEAGRLAAVVPVRTPIAEPAQVAQ